MTKNRGGRGAATVLLWTMCAACATNAQSSPRARPEDVGMSSAGLARLHAALRAAVDSSEVAGVAVLVMRDGRVVTIDTAGYQDLARRAPLLPDAIFRIASMTKAVTSVGVLTLVDEGRIALGDPLAKYIPAFRDVKVAVRDSAAADGARLVPADRPPTIHDLLTHTAGLTYAAFNEGPVPALYRRAGIVEGRAPSETLLADNIERLATLPLVDQPGRAFHYGMSIDVLGRVIEVVSGEPLDHFLTTRVFTPLGMTDTYFVVPDAKRSRIVTPYARENGVLRPVRDPETFGRAIVGGAGSHGSSYLSGGVGLYSTAADYARFLTMLLDGGTFDGHRVLSPNTVRLMTSAAVHDGVRPGWGYGLGIGVMENVSAMGLPGTPGTFGWTGSYATNSWADPTERLIIVALSQRFPANADRLWDQVQTLVYRSIVRSAKP
jgi:CubicO group peptidase (beta-lactamase class C family)